MRDRYTKIKFYMLSNTTTYYIFTRSRNVLAQSSIYFRSRYPVLFRSNYSCFQQLPFLPVLGIHFHPVSITIPVPTTPGPTFSAIQWLSLPFISVPIIPFTHVPIILATDSFSYRKSSLSCFFPLHSFLFSTALVPDHHH